MTTLEHAQQTKSRLAEELTDWRGRQADVAARLATARGRAEGLAVQAAGAVLEGEDPKGVRKERAAVLAEIEELELAAMMAEERLAKLEALQQRAERAVRITAALNRLDAVAAIAERLDEAWGPMLQDLEALALAHREAEDVLSRVGVRIHLGREQLTGILLWRAADLLEVPSVGARDRTSAREALSHTATRAGLEGELREIEKETTTP